MANRIKSAFIPPPQNNYRLVITTASSRKLLEKIADELISKRLAACVQITGKVTSVYRWKGKTEKAGEYMCLIKTKDSLYNAVEKKIKELHSYDVPEIIALPIVAGSAEYFDWIDKSLKDG